MLIPLIFLSLGQGALSLPQPNAQAAPFQKFQVEPRASSVDWNAPRTDHGGFLAKRSGLHSEEFFNNPPRSILDVEPSSSFQAAALEEESSNSSSSKRATSGRWENLSGTAIGHPCPVSWGGQRMDLYQMGKDKRCQHKSRDSWTATSKWGAWEDMAGSFDAPPAACSRKQDNTHLFGKGTDGQCWHRSYSSGTWGAWQSMGGAVAHYPAACSWGKDHAAVYVSSTDGQCWHRRYDETPKAAGWNSWENIGGYLDGPPKAVTWGQDHTSIVCKGQDGQAWHKPYGISSTSKAWGEWENLGGSLDGPPAACAWNGRMDIFAKGTDGACWHKTLKNVTTTVVSWNATAQKNQTTVTTLPKWGSWENMGGKLKEGTPPDVVAVDGGKKMEVYITGDDSAMFRKVWDSTTDKWTDSWEAMGGSVDSKPTAVTWDNGKVDVFGTGADGSIKRCFT